MSIYQTPELPRRHKAIALALLLAQALAALALLPGQARAGDDPPRREEHGRVERGAPDRGGARGPAPGAAFAQRPGPAPQRGFAPGSVPPADRFVPRVAPSARNYTWGGMPYYHDHEHGHWYRPYGGGYLIVTAPFGLFEPVLPPYYTSFWVGDTRYFFADDTYYLYDPRRNGYIVTPSPYAEDVAPPDGAAAPPPPPELFVYPMNGQSEKQQADDRYECHRWAVNQVHYDPTSDAYRQDQRAEYDRALGACLSGRGYTVK